MTTKILALIAASIFLSATISFTQTSYATTSAKTLGTPELDDVFRGLSPAADTSDAFIIAGETSGIGSGGKDGVLTKIDSNGTQIWTKTYGTSNNELFRAIETLDDGYIIAGMTNKGIGKQDVLALKVDSDGSIIWQKAYGTKANNEFAHAVAVTADNGFIFAGYSVTSTTAKDYLVIKTDSNGTIVWERTYSGVGQKDEVIRTVKELSDGSIIAAGWTKSFGVAGDILVIHINTNGTLNWSKTYGGNGFEEPGAIIEMPDGSVSIIEESKSFTPTVDGWMFNINAEDGSINWQRTYGGINFDELSAALLTDDGQTLTLTGETRINKATPEDYFVAKVNVSDGSLVFAERYGSAGLDEAEDIEIAPNGEFVVLGHTKEFGVGMTDLWTTRVSSNGTLLCNCDTSLSTVNVPLDWHMKESTAKPIIANVVVKIPPLVSKSLNLNVENNWFEETIQCE